MTLEGLERRPPYAFMLKESAVFLRERSLASRNFDDARRAAANGFN